ncbi:hypothetical protein EST38_g419 [Candolleomyces aberdarensis]|uniref:Up-regulated during septation protein 1 domain-containing protein n=1 Tax=Candolleomyces aberdarensis TaxID=2316362 RepID=A0A4Q2DZL1_9AGAR|nr:hypothetical protein EST38_g419 [Candolleomyces aberdarensis]
MGLDTLIFHVKPQSQVIHILRTFIPCSRVPVNRDRILSRKSTDQSTESAWIVKQNSTMSQTRDELLMSLMASEAVVDSREYSVLSTEEVEELKKEQTVLASRIAAMTKKLALETKIRDAALSLSKVNSAHRNVSKQTEEQLESANRRVDTAQKELWRLSERGNDVSKRLLEHRAAVLSASVRSMELKMSQSSNSEDSGYDSSNRSTLMSPATAVSTLSSSSKQSKFDGPHLFAGHENAIVPKRKLSPETASKEITALEEKLKAATTSLAESSKIQAELKKELSHIRLEKQEVETMLGLELQTAEDTIAALEQELPRLEGLDREVKTLRQEKLEWDEEKQQLEEEVKEVSVLKTRMQDQELGNVEKSGDAEKMLSGLRAELSDKNQELQQLKGALEKERADWEQERNTLEDEKMDDLARLQEEMDRLREQDEQVLQQANSELNGTLNSLRSLIQRFNIPLSDRSSQTSSMQHLLNAVAKHLDGVYNRMEQLENGGERTSQLEAELQSALSQQQSLAKELEEAKKERDAAKRETFASSRSMSMASSSDSRRSKAESIKSPPMPFANLSNITPENSEFGPEVEGAKFIAALQPLWNVLPSPEARAAKFTSSNSRTYRSSPPGNAAVPNTPGINGAPPAQPSTSLSDLDVRSLKALYDSRRPGAPGSPLAANIQFTLEGFITRVHALLQDDRALIERLIRFAQAHDLLKKNAERAQKLAQDGNLALETYQKQVKLLEEKNSNMGIKNIALQDELRALHDTVERATAEKHQLEAFAAEQAETCRQLGEANDALSARALTLAAEAASAPEALRKQLDDCKSQLDKSKKELEDAQDEIEAMRSAEQGQRIALLDELNTMQTENGQLRAQLRAAKGGR